jgi:hypothetical protein
MSAGPREIAARTLAGPDAFRREIVEACQPVVMRGLVSDWPAAQRGAQSPAAFREYLSQFDAGGQVEAFFGEPRIAGKYYYGDRLQGFNFERRRMRFAEALEAIVTALGQPGSPSVYVGSVPTDQCLPGFSVQNPLPVIPPGVAARIWLGHASNVSAHFDAFDNVACVIAGTRRFTLFPPDAIGHLYVGPIDNTMAGQPVSLAAAASPPDDARFPLFREVREKALVAELGAGDALYIPKLWWHQIEAAAPFNGLVNYWWDTFSIGPDAPYTALLLSMITIAERPPEERKAWKAFFDHYVFRTNGHPLAHLPADQHGILGPLRQGNYGKIRARVMQLLRGG